MAFNERRKGYGSMIQIGSTVQAECARMCKISRITISTTKINYARYEKMTLED
jgi:hypothetical protein